MFDEYPYPPSLPKQASEYERNLRLTHLVWMLAHGSTSAITRLYRMSDDNKRRAWTYSTSDIKARATAAIGKTEARSNGK